MQMNIFPLILKQTIKLSPSVNHFVFQTQQDSSFNFIPGQFITIHIPHQEKTVKRSYSIANSPLQNNIIEFAAGYVPEGIASQFLFNLQPGDTIQASGPFGRLVLKEELPKRYILVATSTGITPYRSMLGELKKRLDSHPLLKIIILQGVQRQEDILYASEFQEFASAYSDRVQFRMHLSRENKDLESQQFLGYVQHAFPDLTLNPEEDVIYLCGNPGMIDESFEDLKNRGFPIQHIIREKYISTK
jgi:ferredoxin-NADP reductase